MSNAVKGLKKTDTLVRVGNLAISMHETARLFAETLSSFNIPLENRKLIILYANEKSYPDERFTKELQQLLQTSPYRGKFQDKVFLLNTSNILGKSDKYVLDDHYNAAVHDKIAKAIKDVIDQHPFQEMQPGQPAQ